MILATALVAPFLALAAALAILGAVRARENRIDAFLLQSGDVDGNGDIVDELRERATRIERATGPMADGLDRRHHLQLVADLIERASEARP